MDQPNSITVLSGDFNCDLLKGDSDSACRSLKRFVSDFELSQYVSVPTYATGSLLDVLIVSGPYVTRCGTRFCHFSPHVFVRAHLCLPIQRRKAVTVRTRSVRRIDTPSFHLDLMAANWSPVIRCGGVTEQWDTFSRIFTPILDQHAPIRDITIRNPTAPPVTDATKDLMARRRQALRDHGRDSHVYRDLNRTVRSAIRRDSRNDIDRRIKEAGPNSVWRNLRAVVGDKKAGQRVLPSIPVEQLNRFFVDVGPRVAAEVAAGGPRPQLDCRLPRVVSRTFDVTPVSQEVLRRTLFSMRNSSSGGQDGISVTILKASFDAIPHVIQHIVNSCLANSDFPASWKHSMVIPIFKSGDSSNPSNFRPISIIPAIAKLVERLVQRQLFYFLASCHLLSPSQHGFRTAHSTETALVAVSDRILAATDRGEISILCLIDLSKCFDTIDHSVLLEKLGQHGICTSWFQAYLCGHTQSVSFLDSANRRHTSRPLPCNMGVFQGSALGPLLFSIFANDLSLFAPEVDVYQYADDTQILVSGAKSDLQTVITRLEAGLTSLDQWFRANGLKVNASKTQIIVFGSHQNIRRLPPVTVNFGGVSLVPCTEVKNLGVIFDRCLSWDSHVAQLTRRCFGTLTGLAHLRHHVPAHVVEMLVTALVLSQVRYCISVYGNGSGGNLNRIQKIINFAVRVVFGRSKYDHVSDLRQRLGWMSSDELVQYHTLRLLHKVLRDGEPECLANMYQTNRSRRERSTRQDLQLHVPASRTNAGKRCFYRRAPALYNSLPPELTELSVKRFNRAVIKRVTTR